MVRINRPPKPAACLKDTVLFCTWVGEGRLEGEALDARERFLLHARRVVD